MRDWVSATRDGDIEVIKDAEAGVWVGRHVKYAVISQGTTQRDAIEATLEAFDLLSRECSRRGLALPRWTS
jgi:hypothetical protein